MKIFLFMLLLLSGKILYYFQGNFDQFMYILKGRNIFNIFINCFLSTCLFLNYYIISFKCFFYLFCAKDNKCKYLFKFKIKEASFVAFKTMTLQFIYAITILNSITVTILMFLLFKHFVK